MQNNTRNLTRIEKGFVKFVRAECKKYGVKFRLRNVEYLRIDENINCSGYFDETVPIIVVAKQRKDWLEILVHEYCHLTQWVENCKEWKKVDKYNSCNKVDMWLAGKNVKDPEFHLTVIRDLELDNEKRAVKVIKKFGLDSRIDIDDYIRKANAYINFYNYLKYTRRWSSPNNSPYKNKELIGSMPKTFRMNYKSLSKKMFKVFAKCGI